MFSPFTGQVLLDGSYNLLFVSTWKLLRCSPLDGIAISFSEHLENFNWPGYLWSRTYGYMEPHTFDFPLSLSHKIFSPPVVLTFLNTCLAYAIL